MPYILPKVGELWLDADGHRNLVLREEIDESDYIYTLLTLDTGETWDSEHENGWNMPYRNGNDPFYYRRIG